MKSKKKSKKKSYRTRGKTYKVRSKVSRKSYRKSYRKPYRKSTKKRKNKRRGSKKRKLYGGSFKMVEGILSKTDVFEGVVIHPGMYALSNKYSDEQNELASLPGMEMAEIDPENEEQLEKFKQHILKAKKLAEKAAMLEAMSKEIDFVQFTNKFRPSGLTDTDEISLGEIWKRLDPKEWRAQNFTSESAKQAFIEEGGEVLTIREKQINQLINTNPGCSYDTDTGVFKYGPRSKYIGRNIQTNPPKEWKTIHPGGYDINPTTFEFTPHQAPVIHA